MPAVSVPLTSHMSRLHNAAGILERRPLFHSSHYYFKSLQIIPLTVNLSVNFRNSRVSLL